MDAEGDSENREEGKSIAQRLQERIQTVEEIEHVLNFYIHDMGENVNLNTKTNKDRLVTRLNYWAAILGKEAIENACKIDDNGFIRLLETYNNDKNVFVVGAPDGWHEAYFITQDGNLCKCDFFKKNVIDKRSTYLCEHLIAVRIAKMRKLRPLKRREFKVEESTGKFMSESW
ncbi:hypothetical protein M3Y97_00819600 [Aphelenchoides bicaudatus]|nr:hypothetical protein M3Y97_00819600 [Aphelenchoides bicaudatus]